MSHQIRKQRFGVVILLFFVTNGSNTLSFTKSSLSRSHIVSESCSNVKNAVSKCFNPRQHFWDVENRCALHIVMSSLSSNSEDGAKIDNTLEDIEENFKTLLDEAMAATDSVDLPSILSRNIEVVLKLTGQTGVEVIKSILQKSIRNNGEQETERLSEVIELVLSFAEEFVQQANEIENQNKKLLGEIIRTISNKDITTSRREDMLDALFQEQRARFTPGFLRHIEAQRCRIENAPSMSSESMRLREMLSAIQTRVLEELVSGEEWGEAAQVIGHLVGYENSAELTAVLEAGLTIRGIDFADELVSLTKEALEGFQKLPGGVDPKLVAAVENINRRSMKFQLDHKDQFE
jgi:hypothetical protein